MKSLQDLIQDSDNLNRFMNQSVADKYQNHLLTKIEVEYAQQVYLTLSMSVAENFEQIDESADNPVIYVCRIAAALNNQPDIQENLRRSLLIDEKTLSDYAYALEQHDLQNIFLFDALTIIMLYGNDNPDILNYVTGIVVKTFLSKLRIFTL